nr:Serine/arginine-rich protein-specific kinase [Euglena gracilis]
MGKRPLENPSQGRTKRPCIKSLATKASPLEVVNDKRKSGGFNVIHQKRTVPQPFQLSSRSAWREAQAQRQRELDEARRQQLETFKPTINVSSKRMALAPLTTNAQTQAPKQQLENCKPAVSVTSKQAVPAPVKTSKQAPKPEEARRQPLENSKFVVNAASKQGACATLKANKQVQVPKQREAEEARRQPDGCKPAISANKPTATASLKTTKQTQVKANSARGPCPQSSPRNVVRVQAPTAVNPLAPPSKSYMLSRRNTVGPAQHRMSHKIVCPRRVVTFEEPNTDMQLDASAPSALVDTEGSVEGGSRATTKGFPSAIPMPPCLMTPKATSSNPRSNSAPIPGTCTRSDSSCTGIQISDDDEESVRNYGPDGYCHIVKGSTFCEGRYTALHKLGEGKYSTVWLMHDRDGPYTEFSNFVAVKVGRAMASDVLPEDIKREANLLEYINATHDPSDLRYLATVIGSFVHEGRHGLHACMVFKVLGAQLLRLVYERNEAFRAGVPLDVPSVINIFRCILRGTAGFHRKNIVHTDLKPENILLAVPDPEVVEQMKLFTREHQLPEPYLEHRPQASVTPHRPGKLASPETAAKRSDSVDALNFWKKSSPPDALNDADNCAVEPNHGRPTMAFPAREASFALQAASVDALDELPSQPSAREAATIEVPGPVFPASADRLQQLPPPNFIAQRRGAAAHETSPPLCAEGLESPPMSMALRRTPTKGSGAMELDEDSAPKDPLLVPLTPQGEGRRVNPSTPQYVLEQGKGTEVLIGDFGLAMVLEHGHDLAPPGVHIYPQDCVAMNHNHGMVIQTREYRAPEILLGQDFNVKIDIYSIACIMVELITGEYLWDPKNTVPRRSAQSEQEIDREHFQHMIEVLGVDEFPKLRARRTYFKARFFMPNGEPRLPPARRRKPKSRPLTAVLAPHVPEPVLPALAFLLGKMLEFHPNDRWSATQCLEFLDQPVFAEQSTVSLRVGRYSLRSSMPR